ncbi:PKD-like domain-containing protein [Flavobacterium sp.]|uniref:PKD-like domain-containing protein n=1 Tax=Flavobacterium sp. TaxID=239 RepID=UPI00404A5CA7
MKKLFLTFFVVFFYNFGIANEHESALVPTATISGNATVCQNAPSPVITFTGSGGIAPYTFTYTLNGNPQTDIVTISGNSVTLPVVTSSSGTFTYSLVRVIDSTNEAQNQAGTAVITVTAEPSVDFSFVNNQCSSTAVQFNSTVTGSGSYTYAWDFGDGGTSTQQNPTHLFEALGCSNSTFNVTLTVTSTSCVVTKTYPITIKQKPDISFNDVNFPFDPFSNCSNASSNSVYSITVGNQSISTCIASFSINWGDGNIENNVTFPLSHTYLQTGAYTMNISAVGSNGCVSSKSYTIKNVSNPLGGLNSPGSTQNLCAPTAELQFSISNWGTNSLDTNYTINYGDGTPVVILSQNQLISSSFYNSSNPENSANYPIPHAYNSSSCPNSSYIVSLDVTNACGTTPFTLGNISVLIKPQSNFTAPPIGCVNTNILFTNTTISGYGQSCNQNAIFTWDFGDGTPIVTTPISSPQNINHTYTTPGTYTVILTSQNFCGQTTKTQQICIEPVLIPQFTLSNISGCVPMAVNTTNNTNLTNQCSTPTSTWSVTYASGNCGTSSAYTYTGGTSATSASPSFNFTEAGTYTITLTTSNSCTPSQSTSQTVVVKKPPTVAINSINNLCQTDISTIINPTANINGCAPASSTLTYAWSFPGGNPVSSNLANPGPITYSTFGTYTVSLSVTNECGTTVATNKTFTINPSPTITGALFTCIGNTSQLGGSPTAATGTAWVSSNPSIATVSNTGLVTGISVGVTNITYTNSNGCQKTVVFTVNPLPTITGNLNVCVASTTQLTGSATAASTNAWTSSNTSVATVNNSGFVTGIAVGTTIITYTNSNGCQITATVTVNPLPTITGILNVCVGSTRQLTGSAIAASTNAWTSSNTSVATVNNSGFVTGISAGNAIITYTNSNGCQITTTVTVNALPTITGTLITCAGSTTQLTGSATAATTNAWTSSNISVATVNNSGLVTGVSAGNVIITYINSNGCQITATLTVNPSPVVTFSPSNQTICSENTSTLVTLSSTTPGATFSWTASQPTGITGVITSGTNTIPSQNLVNSTNAPITINYVAVAATNGTSTCAGSTYSYTIIVNPRPNITESFTEAICSGESFSITPSNSALNSIPVGTTYSWSAPIITGGITGGVSATNQTSISGTLVNPTNIVQTATYTVTPSYNGCAGNTFTVVISVNPKPVIANVTHPAICSETAFTVTPTNGSGNIVPTGTTYAWTISNNSNITGASASSSTGISTISQTLNNTSNSPQTIVYTVTPTSGDTGNCIGNTFTITVVVNPKPLVMATTQTICSGTAFTATPTNGSGNIVPSTTTYTWTTPVSTPAGAITGGSAQTTGANTISQTLTNTTTEVATIEYIVTPISGACAGIPFTITVTVNPTPTTLGLTNQTYCNAIPTNEIVLNNSVSGTTYAWTNSNTAIGLAASGTGNIPVFTPTNNGTAPITATISVIATANGCSRVAETFTITVNPSPAVNFSPANQTICSGESSALVTLSSTTPGATFSWTAVQPTGITGVITSGTNTIPAQNLVNSTNAPITIIYFAVAATNGTSTCAGSTYNYTIIVNPRPNIENQSFIICSEEGFTVAPVNGVPDANTIVPSGTTYNWVISNNPNISGASSGTGNQISQVLINNSTLIQTIVYTVTPIAGICTGNTFTITIDVYPKPNVTFDIPIQTICNETNTSLVTLNSTLPGNITYEWNATIPSGITGALSSGTNTIPVQTLINTTNSPLTITYAATATFNNNGSSCEGNVYNYSITVNPTFTSSGIVSNYNGYNVSFFGANDGAINLTTIGGSGTYTYSWTGPNGFTSTAEDISALIAGTYTVTINDGYCAPIVLTFTLTQPPELLIQPDLSLTINLICFADNNGAVGVLITQESVPPYDYELYNSNGILVTSITDSTNLNPQFTGLIAGVYSLTVIDANGGRKTVTGLTVSQPDDIIITATTTPITCYGANNASITLTVAGGTGPYQAQWDNLATGFYQNNLAAGNYSILVTDNNGCTKTIVVNIPEAPIFTINPVVVNISCFGANDGSINLNLIGGISPINLTWSDGSTAGLVRNNLPPGVYTVTIVDSKPCTIIRSFTIVEPQPLVLGANLQDALDCNDANSGSINLLVSGGTPPFTYNWSNGTTTEDLNNIPAGNYAVLVTDSRGCTQSAQYSINRPQPLTLDVETNTNVNCETREITQIFEAQVSGGVPPIQLNWSSGTVSGANNEFMTTEQDGLVILTATDAIGCTTTYSLNVDIPVIGNADFNQSSYGYTAYGIYSILDPIQFTNMASGDFVSILWDFGDGIFSNEENPIHTYILEGDYVVTQTVTYPFGCVYIHTISLIIEKGYVLVVPTAFTPNNDSLNDTFRPVTRGLKNVRMDVYDTWGSLIYSETGDVLRGWDGTIRGIQSENGNYNCKVSAETFYGRIITAEETFVLIK